jgi:probable DNA metabolism protein
VFVYQCEDSLESIFTAIYNVYEDKRDISEVFLSLEDELRLFASYIPVSEDIHKVSKVIRSLKRRFGEDDYLHLCYALSSPSPDKAQAVFRTIVGGLTAARSEKTESRCHTVADSGQQTHHRRGSVSGSLRGHLFDNLADDSVHLAYTLGKAACNEHHLLLGFLRFQELEDGILFAKIGPKNNIVTFLMPHFADRLPGENFVIYDAERNFFGVHPAGGSWYLIVGSEEAVDHPEDRKNDRSMDRAKDRSEEWSISGGMNGIENKWSKEERVYQELFCRFCHRIAIKERENLKYQRSMLPLRFQEYMIEFHNNSQKHNLNV